MGDAAGDLAKGREAFSELQALHMLGDFLRFLFYSARKIAMSIAIAFVKPSTPDFIAVYAAR